MRPRGGLIARAQAGDEVVSLGLWDTAGQEVRDEAWRGEPRAWSRASPFFLNCVFEPQKRKQFFFFFFLFCFAFFVFAFSAFS